MKRIFSLATTWVFGTSFTITVALLSGCSSSPSVTGPTAQQTADAVRQLYTSAAQPVPTTGTPPTTTIPHREFAMAGYRLVDAGCSGYFDALTKASNKVKMSKADWTAVGTAAAVIATLAEATPKEIGITAAGFGLGSLIIDNYEQYAFATPYPIQTRSLVFRALQTYRDSSPPEAALSLDDAADRIAGYARLCTYSGIATLSQDAIAKAEPEDTAKSKPLFTEEETRMFLDPVDTSLGLPAEDALTDNDYAVLAVIADPGITSSAQLDTLKKMFSAELVPATIQSRIVNNANTKVSGSLEPIGLLLGQLAARNNRFAAQVQGIKAALTSGTPPSQPPARLPMIRVR